jgi:dephospho-CoA kinase
MVAKIFIITGGIASGKTFLLKFISSLGYSTFNSDLIVKKLLADKKFLLEENNINLENYKEKILQEAGFLEKLEKLLYPEIARERALWLERELEKNKFLFIEVPLLFEKFPQGLILGYPYEIISTVAGLKLQRKRAIKRGVKPELLEFLLAKQVSDQVRLAKSNLIIYTSQSKRKVKKLIKKIINVSTN